MSLNQFCTAWESFYRSPGVGSFCSAKKEKITVSIWTRVSTWRSEYLTVDRVRNRTMQSVNGEFAIVSSVKTYMLEIVFKGQVVQHPGGDAPMSRPFSRPGSSFEGCIRSSRSGSTSGTQKS
jgi:hypothetical protein